MSAQDVNLFTELGSDATALTLEEIKVLDFYQQKPTTNSVKLVRVAENFSSSNELRFRPIGQELQRTGRKSSVTIEDASITNVWVGNLEETNGGGHLILFNTPLGTMGSMIYGDKTVELFPLRPDISVYVESNNDTNPVRDCPDIDESVASAANTLLCEEANNCEATVDVLVLIHNNAFSVLSPFVSLTTKGPGSPYFSAPYPVKYIIKQKIQAEIARTNLAFLNSDIKNKKLRLAGVEYIDMALSKEVGEDLDLIIGSPFVKQLRVNSRADIVVVITNQKYPDAFGLATQFPYAPSRAYCIVESSTIGGSRYTFSHEVGHLLGAEHDTDQKPGCAHGHELSNSRGTILAAVASRILHYSNPEINYNGEVTGIIDKEDNARKMKNSACIVGTFSQDPNNNSLNLMIGKESMPCNSTSRYTALIVSAFTGATGFTYNWDYSSDISFVSATALSMNTKEITIGNLLKPSFFLRVKVYDFLGNPYTTIVKKISVIQPCPEPPSTTLTSIALFPNPAAEELNISYNTSEDSNFEINIFSLEGSRMYNATLPVVRGLGNYSLDVNDIPSGSYYMRLVSARETIVLPFIKE